MRPYFWIIISCLVVESPCFQLEFQSTPVATNINPFTDEFKLRCHLTNPRTVVKQGSQVQADDPKSNESLRHVMSIIITRDGTHLAMITQLDPAQVLVDFGQTSVTGNVSGIDEQSAFLEFNWKNPNQSLAGVYRCEMNAFNEFGHNVILTESLSISNASQVITMEQIAQVIQTDREIIKDLQLSEKENQMRISDLEKKVSDLQNSYKAIDIQSGKDSCHNTGETVTGRFPRPYSKIPKMIVGISRVNSDQIMLNHIFSLGLDYYVHVKNVNTTHYEIKCIMRFIDGHNLGIEFNWISYN